MTTPAPPTTEPASPPDETVRRARTLLLALFGCLIGTYFASTLTLPAKALALPFAVAGIVFGVLALRRVAKAGVSMLLPTAATAGMLGCLLFAGLVVAQMVFWEATVAFESCVSGALTDRALHQCSAEYNTGLGIGAP
ncbi:MAG: hypothetical protein ACTHZ5_13100 [Micrococcaceae bacterium]